MGMRKEVFEIYWRLGTRPQKGSPALV